MPNNQPLWSIDIEIRKNDRCIYKNVHYSTSVFGIWISNLHKSCHILPYKRLKYEKPPINLNHFLFFRWSAWKFAKKSARKWFEEFPALPSNLWTQVRIFMEIADYLRTEISSKKFFVTPLLQTHCGTLILTNPFAIANKGFIS